MIILDSTTESLEILLAGAVTTTQAPFSVSYADHNASVPSFTPGSSDGQTNGTTAVTLASAPASGVQRQIKRINIYNADSAAMTVTIRLNNGGTLRTILSVTLQTGERIEYEDSEGFRVFTVTGAVKVTAVASTVEPGYIDGLVLSWNSATSISVSSGTAYIPSVGANVNVASAITKAGLVLSASSFHHVYLFLNAGVPDVEVVTTVPSSPYNGNARTKSGDTTRRYLGTILSDAGSNAYRFQVDTGMYRYMVDTNTAPFRALSGGMATVATTVSLSATIPITTRQTLLALTNLDAAQGVRLTIPALPAVILQNIRQASSVANLFQTDSSQQIAYFFSAAPAAGFFVDVIGYGVER